MIRKRIVRRTEPVKDPVTQPNLFFEKEKPVKEKQSAIDVMMDLQYNKIPNIHKRNPNCSSYFIYKGTFFRKESVTPAGMWIGKNVSGLSSIKTCKASPEDCIRLPKQDDLVELYDFITNFKSFQDDKTTFWALEIVLFKLENILKTEYHET